MSRRKQSRVAENISEEDEEEIVRKSGKKFATVGFDEIEIIEDSERCTSSDHDDTEGSLKDFIVSDTQSANEYSSFSTQSFNPQSSSQDSCYSQPIYIGEDTQDEYNHNRFDPRRWGVTRTAPSSQDWESQLSTDSQDVVEYYREHRE